MENEYYSKAHAVTELLRIEEAKQVKKFMRVTESHFKVGTCDDAEYEKIKFVAEKSFRYGFHKGMLAVFDAMDRVRQEQMERN